MVRFNWSGSEEVIHEAVSASYSVTETLRRLGLDNKGGNYKTCKKYIELFNIDKSHFKTQGELISGKRNVNHTTLDEYLCSTNPVNQVIRKKMVAEGIKPDVCEICGQGNTWNDRPLVLQIDHMDGDNQNNNLTNLRIICPNCHTQTKTFGFKSRVVKRHCIICTSPIMTGNNKTCSRECHAELARRITTHDNPIWLKYDLSEMIKTMTNTQIAQEIGFTETSVRKRLKKLNLTR